MEKITRVLHILQRMEAGGTQALLMGLYRNIDRSKLQFDFLVEYPDKQFYDDEILSLGGKIYYSNVRNDKNILKFQKLLKDIINDNNYKIVHVHAFTIGYFCLKTAYKCGVPIRIAHSHNNETVRDKKYFIKRLMQKIYTIYSTDLFACSQEAGKYLFKEKKFKVLNNAIDSEKFVYDIVTRKVVRDELNIRDNEVLIGNVGRLHAQKNQLFLLETFYEYNKINNNSKLLIVGSGDLKNLIKQKLKELNIENSVIMLENRSDMYRLYQAMDIFVLPSIFEGLGIVAVEAQAAGLPVIASTGVSKNAGITELIEYVDLDCGPNKWAELISKKIDKRFSRKNTSKKVIDAGYDLRSTVKYMQEYYISSYNEVIK